ncbi:MAG: HD-GYP domain-containing protein, partial [Clostridiales bacterium]|nr:HD-GYP domain-containing protein [Clostridiales bacterium]
YIVMIYCGELRRIKKNHRFSFFDGLLLLSIVCLILDGTTAYTVNHLDVVNITANMILHMLFFLALDSVIFLLFLYMLSNTGGLPKKRWKRLLLYSPYFINILIVVLSIGSLEYRIGRNTNYSMGIPVYACFIMAGVYLAMTLAVFFGRRNYIESRKRIGIFTYQFVLSFTIIFQMIVPEALISSAAVTMLILGVYMNMENPALEELNHYHSEMVLGFATLMEGKDDNTGGHIRRTARYVKLLAEELSERGYYADILTKDYIENLYKAAPLHDIGKISVPDSILQKPGRLTDEEFTVMKQHTVNGGKIIQDTFWHLGDDEYNTMAYQVALCHHEKWNGTGYPNGLKGNEIPLCARIMAIADVFDAVSEKRCYRDSMPLDKCFEIIKNGIGSDFEPILAEVFLDIRPKVVDVYNWR